jgi:hypothetical protein
MAEQEIREVLYPHVLCRDNIDNVVLEGNGILRRKFGDFPMPKSCVAL